MYVCMFVWIYIYIYIYLRCVFWLKGISVSPTSYLSFTSLSSASFLGSSQAIFSVLFPFRYPPFPITSHRCSLGIMNFFQDELLRMDFDTAMMFLKNLPETLPDEVGVHVLYTYAERERERESVCACMYVCMYVCMHACMHVCVCMYACMCVYVCMYVNM